VLPAPLAARAIALARTLPLLERARREVAACVAIDARDNRNQPRSDRRALAHGGLIDRNADLPSRDRRDAIARLAR
jgi:hypothetical protein